MRLCEMKRIVSQPTSRAQDGRKRSVFGSSSGASTSSSRQNGAGFNWNSANTSAVAVSAFSPPDSRWIDALRFAGRLRDDLDTGVEDFPHQSAPVCDHRRTASGNRRPNCSLTLL